jgi:hypothetical protein
LGTLNYDTFPRNGTRTLGAMLGLAFPNHNIFWGEHNPKTLSKSNAITVIRPFKEVIASWFSFFPNNNFQQGIDTYVHFYEYIKEFDVFYCSLTDLTTEPNKVLSRYSKKYNLGDAQPVDMKEYKIIMTEQFPINYPRAAVNDRQTIFQAIEACDLSKIEPLWHNLNEKCAI